MTDLTYLATAEGFLYLAALKNLYHGEIVGHALGAHTTKTLVTQALEQAIRHHKPPRGLIHHSDRGSRYCAHKHQQPLRTNRLKASMNRKGDCYDNAPIESFWGVLKTEWVYHRRYPTRAQAIEEITHYIEIFYNRQRRQAQLGFLSPAAYRERYWQQQQAA